MMVDLLMVSHFKPGEEVIKEGSEGDSMYIVAGRDMPLCVCPVCLLLAGVDFFLELFRCHHFKIQPLWKHVFF